MGDPLDLGIASFLKLVLKQESSILDGLTCSVNPSVCAQTTGRQQKLSQKRGGAWHAGLLKMVAVVCPVFERKVRMNNN